MLTIKEAAERLRVTEKTIRRWIKKGKLEASKPGRKYLIPKSEIERLLSLQQEEEVQNKEQFAVTSLFTTADKKALQNPTVHLLAKIISDRSISQETKQWLEKLITSAIKLIITTANSDQRGKQNG